MHPLVWAASKDKRLLFPYTAAREIKTGISKGSTEIESFGVCVENIDRSIICHRFVHASVGIKQELILFADGNKLIDDHTLVALTIMIAESKPDEKEMMISVIMNCICG